MKLIAEITVGYVVGSDIGKICDTMLYACGTFNGNLANEMFGPGTDYYEGDNWKDYIREFIRVNNIGAICAKWPFKYGFGGTHFWLHDEYRNRVLMIYESE